MNSPLCVERGDRFQPQRTRRARRARRNIIIKTLRRRERNSPPGPLSFEERGNLRDELYINYFAVPLRETKFRLLASLRLEKS